MAEMTALDTRPDEHVPVPLPDEENPAIQDARKVFLITVGSAVVFIAIAVVVALLERLG